MCDAILLAAGYASRVGSNKLALPYKDTSVIETLIEQFKPFCSQIVVVTGYYHDALKDLLSAHDQVKIVYNHAYDQGMFSSVLSGLDHVHGHVLICPGDTPNISQDTIKHLLESPKDIAVPQYNGRKGHPLLVRKALLDALRAHPKTSNLRDFRNQYDYDIIQVTDSGIYEDIDTLTDYMSMRQKEVGYGI